MRIGGSMVGCAGGLLNAQSILFDWNRILMGSLYYSLFGLELNGQLAGDL